jgi:hypothetical protein
MAKLKNKESEGGFYFFSFKSHRGSTRKRANTLKYNPTNGTAIITKISHCFCVMNCAFLVTF